MVPSILTPVLEVWFLLFLHLFWQYGTFCFYTCSARMVTSVFTPVLAVWYLLYQKVPFGRNRCKNRRYLTARTGVKTEGTILPEQV
jgi:hypothetical protein